MGFIRIGISNANYDSFCEEKPGKDPLPKLNGREVQS